MEDNSKKMEHTNDNCHNITCKYIEQNKGYNIAIDELSKFIHEKYTHGVFSGFDIAILTDKLEDMKSNMERCNRERLVII